MTAEDELARLSEALLNETSFMGVLGPRLVGIGDGWAEMALDWRENLVGDVSAQTIASGAIFAFMDNLSGLALFTALKPPEPLATLDLRVDYLRPSPKGETIYGRAEVVKLTRRVGFVRAVAHNGDAQHPVANVTGTFMRTSQK